MTMISLTEKWALRGKGRLSDKDRGMNVDVTLSSLLTKNANGDSMS